MKKNNLKEKHNWYIINAQNQILGRLATKIAYYLQGKHKINYKQNIDHGDYIIVLNAKNISITGNKMNNKFYYHHTGYIGGLKKISFKDVLIKNPKRIIEKAVKGMLPKNKLSKHIFKKLKIYNNNIHKHDSQKPQILNI